MVENNVNMDKFEKQGQQEGHPACKKWGMVEVGTV